MAQDMIIYFLSINNSFGDFPRYDFSTKPCQIEPKS